MIEAVENLFIFFPTPAAQEWLPPPSPLAEDLFLTLKDVIIHAWWCPPPGWNGSGLVLLYLHGNAGNLSQRGLSVARWQEELNAAVLILDYPGYGRSTGRPSEAGCYAAAATAYEWLMQKNVRPEQVVIYGGSLGGAVAVEQATRREHRALILVNTFASIRDMGRKLYPRLPVNWMVHDRFNSLARIGRCRRPVFIAHGTEDRLVPFEHGQRLFAAANEPKQFYPLVGNDHHDAPTKEFYAAVRAFLGRCPGERGA